jgi:flagellar hook-associated protein 1 FlgK
MSLGQALATAMSGLRVTQASLALVSSNVANAETPGYVRKTLTQVATTGGDIGSSVRTTGVNRELDKYVQAQLWTETSGAAYANQKASTLNALQGIYGDPGSAGTLETAFNTLTSALQALSTSSDSQAARITAVNAAQSLTQQLNSMSQGIQSLRANAESDLSSSVASANTAMSQIADINVKLLGLDPNDPATASLLDQRDQAIGQLSQLMDIRVVTNDANQATVFTNSGVQLVGVQAAQLSFDAQGTMTPNTVWNSDPAKSGVGSITVNFPNGGNLDLVATHAIRSGKIAADLELRDQTLVQAQTQLDQFAAAMASAVSDKTTAGTAATSGASNGFDLDLSGMQSGNVIHLTYTDASNTQHQLSIVRVDDPTVLPLQDSATIDPNDKVLGIDFSGGMSSVVSQLNAALGSSNLQFSNTGSTLRVLDNGTGQASVNAASTTITASALSNGGVELPLFTDGNSLYTGAMTASGSQSAGLAARLTVNSAVVGDPSKLVQYSSSTLSGDTTRSDFLYTQLTSGSYQFSAQTGLGTAASPFKSTLLSFSQQIMSTQGEAAASAQQLADGQNVVLGTLQQKLDSTAGVNIDEEMAHLLSLQNAYAANARVMSVIKDMYTSLLQI